MRRLLSSLSLIVALCGMPQSIMALCSGPNLLDRLSEEERAAFQARASDIPYGTGLLWSATRGGTEIVLIGTMHLPDPRHDAIRARVADTIAGADALLVEMTPDEETALMEAIAGDATLTTLTDGPSLIDLLPPEDWEAIAEAARLRGIPPFMAAKFQPWFLMLSLAMPPCALPDLAAGAQGLDHLLMEDAATLGVPMIALEPWDTLLDMIATAPMEDQIDLLRLSLIEPALQAEMMVALFDAYFSGRIGETWELSELSLQFVPPEMAGAAAESLALTERMMLDDRNIAWIPVIETAAEDHDRIVVAAGAAHLPGEVGLLRLLEEAGWRIAPLP